MFIQCSDCDYKYIVNSADLKPDGRMVECANCNHRWFQEPLKGEDLLSSSVPKTSQEKPLEKEQESQNTNNSKSEIGWGHQIRSYVLQPYRLVKDNRTNFESTSPDKVLDGDLDEFLEQSLYQIK